jgi:hypothetical protein
MMTSSPGAFRHSPEPDVVEALTAEGLAHSVDEVATGHLQVAYGQTARLYRGSEPFGQGHKPDPEPIDKRIEAVEKARAVGERLNNLQLLWISNLALGLLYGMAGRYQANLDLAMKDLEVVDRLASRIHQGDAVRRAAVAVMTIGGDYEEGLRLAKWSLDLSRDTNPHQVMHGTCPVMMALFELGRSDEISPFLDEHLEAFRLDPAVECDFVRDGPIIGAVLAALSGDRDRAWQLRSLIGDPLAEIDRATAWQSTLEVALGQPQNAREISGGKALEGRSYGPLHARALLEALIALKDWDALAGFVPLARRHAAGLAVLTPCCDRAEGLLARAGGDLVQASAALDRAQSGFRALHAHREFSATSRLLT